MSGSFEKGQLMAVYLGFISSYLHSLVSVRQKCYHHVDKQNDSHDQESAVQQINHGH